MSETTAKNINKVLNSVNSKIPSGESGISLGALRKILIMAVVIVFIVIAGIMAYDYIFKGKMGIFTTITTDVIPFIHDATKTLRFTHSSLPLTGNYANYNMWMYISSYKYRKDEDKCVLYKGKVTSGEKMNDVRLVDNKSYIDEGMPGVWLLRQTNTLRIIVPLETTFKGNVDKIEVQTCDVENIPLQRWVSVNITISDNILDVWIDGYLRKSFSLGGFPKINENALHICPDGGFEGYLSKVSVSNAPLSIKEIKNIYETGPTLKPNFMARLSNALF